MLDARNVGLQLTVRDADGDDLVGREEGER